MKILSNRFDLEFGDGETMTVEITDSEGTANLINYAINEVVTTLPQQKPYERTLTLTPPDAVASPSYLTVTVHFVVEEGGRFLIHVRGNYSDETSDYEHEQETLGSGKGEPYKQLNYKLAIKVGGGRR